MRVFRKRMYIHYAEKNFSTMLKNATKSMKSITQLCVLNSVLYKQTVGNDNQCTQLSHRNDVSSRIQSDAVKNVLYSWYIILYESTISCTRLLSSHLNSTMFYQFSNCKNKVCFVYHLNESITNFSHISNDKNEARWSPDQNVKQNDDSFTRCVTYCYHLSATPFS